MVDWDKQVKPAVVNAINLVGKRLVLRPMVQNVANPALAALGNDPSLPLRSAGVDTEIIGVLTDHKMETSEDAPASSAFVCTGYLSPKGISAINVNDLILDGSTKWRVRAVGFEKPDSEILYYMVKLRHE